MKKVAILLWFVAWMGTLTSPVTAALSLESTQMIQQAQVHCEKFDNTLIYSEYWKGSVKPEHQQSVCIAEKFADLVAEQGNSWLEQQAESIIEECQSRSTDNDAYVQCLKVSLDETASTLTGPCIEIGSEQLWEEDKCSRLVTYIFMKRFEELLAEVQSRESESVDDLLELSLTSKWLIQQSMDNCERSGNELVYKEYWRDAVNAANANMVCLAEQFAIQVAGEGDSWLEEKSGDLIEDCKKKGKHDATIYFRCLKDSLGQVSASLSVPCSEIGEKGLWDAQMCHRLVAYIFTDNFEKIQEEQRTGWDNFNLTMERYQRNICIKLFANPIVAILFFVFYVLDVVFLIERGTWMRITKAGMAIGPFVLIACFIGGGIRMFFSLLSIVLTSLLIAWNHRKVTVSSKKQGPKEIEF